MSRGWRKAGRALAFLLVLLVAPAAWPGEAVEYDFGLGFDETVNPELLRSHGAAAEVDAAVALFRRRGSLAFVVDKVMVEAVAADVEGEGAKALALWAEAATLAESYRLASGDDFFVSAVARWRSATRDEKLGWARALELLKEARELRDAGELEEFAAAIEQVATLWLELRDPHGAALALRNVQQHLQHLGDETHLPRLHDLLTRMATLWEQAGHERERAVALGWLAHVEARAGDATQAAILTDDVWRMLEELGDRWTLMRVLEGWAERLGWTGEYDEARPLLERARTIAADLGDAYSEGRVVELMGMHDHNLGRDSRATAALLEARALYESVGAGTESIDVNLAWVTLGRGDAVQALRHARATGWAEQVDFPRGQLEVARIRGHAKGELLDWLGAMAEWELAGRLAAELAHLPILMGSLNARGQIHEKLGDESAARALLAEQVAFLRRNADHSGLTRWYPDVSQMARRLGETEVARELLESYLRSLVPEPGEHDHGSEGPDHHDEHDHAGERADAHTWLGELAELEGEQEAAARHFHAAEELLSRRPEYRLAAAVRFHLARRHQAIGSPRRALELCRDAVADERLVALVAEESPEPEWIRWGLEIALSLLSDLAANADASEFEALVDESLQVAQVTQASELRRLLQAAELEGDPRAEELSERADELLDELSRHQRELAEEVDGARQDELRAMVERLEDEHDLARRAAALHAWRARRRQPDRLDLAEVRSLLRPGEILLQYFLGPERVFGWSVTRGRARFLDLAARADVVPRVEFLSSALAQGRPPASCRAAATRLNELLVAPLLEGPGTPARLVVAPDGVLGLLPLDVVLAASATAVGPAVRVVPALSLLRAGESSRARAGVLVVADPTLPPGSGRSGEPTEGAAYQRGGFDLAPLQHARWEARRVAAELRGSRSVTTLEGAAAAERTLKELDLEKYALLHFTTHALADERAPLRSAVVLAPDEEGRDDGFLQAREIARLELDAELVVLSGCSTGRGRLVEGEGIEGLGQAFLVAGARSLLVSLWDVDDRSTALLMADFYRGLGHGLDEAEALRRAKHSLASRQRGRWSHPYYWAAFVLVGTSR